MASSQSNNELDALEARLGAATDSRKALFDQIDAAVTSAHEQLERERSAADGDAIPLRPTPLR